MWLLIRTTMVGPNVVMTHLDHNVGPKLGPQQAFLSRINIYTSQEFHQRLGGVSPLCAWSQKKSKIREFRKIICMSPTLLVAGKTIKILIHIYQEF